MRGTLSTQDGATGIHVKLHRTARWTDRVRDLVRGPRGIAELLHLQEAERRGLPCTPPLAAGICDDDGHGDACSFLISQTVVGAEPIPRGGKPNWPIELASAAGALLRRAHDSGLHARDLHPENMLWQRDDDGIHIVLCDLTSVLWAEPLERSQRAHALAFFCLDLDGLVLDPVATPLVRTYGADTALLDAAQRRAKQLRQRALRSFGKRAFRSCKHTRVERFGNERWSLCQFDGSPPLHAQARGFAQSPAPDSEAFKSGRRGAVHLIEDLAIKRRAPSKARGLLEAGYWLTFAGVPSAAPVALQILRTKNDRPTGDRGGLAFFRRIDNPNLAEEIATGSLTEEDVAGLAADFGQSIGRMHAFGLRCRDLKFDNLVRDGGRLVLVDLDGVRRKADLCDSRGEAADLGRLLAAWRSAGEPGAKATVATFWRYYNRTRRRLSSTITRRDLRQTIRARADAWALEHDRHGH